MPAKVSVVIPIYNIVGKLRNTLDSVIKQTLADIEIICVDDGSTDGSRQIIREYMEKDERIAGIFFENNCGTSEARKQGVAGSSGKYVMFLDGDDELLPEACRIAYEAIEMSGTDIVQFMTRINNVIGYPKQKLFTMQNGLEPCLEKLINADIVRSCWIDKRFNFSLWNKIYHGDLCRRAFSHIEEGRFPRGQDLYAFFLIAYYAKSYTGIKDTLYIYNWDNGILKGSKSINLDTFERYLSEKKVYLAIERFLQQNSTDPYTDVLEVINTKFFKDNILHWKNYLKTECVAQGFVKMADTWGFHKVLCYLAENFWSQQESLCKKLKNIDAFRFTGRTDKRKMTLAVYHRFNNPVLSEAVVGLCQLWKKLKGHEGFLFNDVIVITDESAVNFFEKSDSNFPIEYLPDKKACTEIQYPKRLDVWQQIIENRKIDIVVYADKQDEVLFWDMLSIKGSASKPGFIFFSQRFSSLAYKSPSKDALEQLQYLSFADAVVTNIQADMPFIVAFAQQASYIPLYVAADSLQHTNSISAGSNEDETGVNDCESNDECTALPAETLLWPGEITTKRHNLEILKTIQCIAREIPQIKLYITGNLSEEIEEHLTKLIIKRQLTENIYILHHEELTRNEDSCLNIYGRTSLLLCAEENDADINIFAQSLLHGIPVATYAVPWLPFSSEEQGVCQIGRYQYEQLAEKVIWLLNNPDELKRLGHKGNDYVKGKFYKEKSKEWTDFFEAVRNKAIIVPEADRLNVKTLLHYMTLFQDEGKRAAVQIERESAAKLQKELNSTEKKLDSTQKKLDSTQKKLDSTQKKLDSTQKKLDNTQKKLDSTQKKLEKTQKEKLSLASRYSSVLNSWSYRIGRKVTVLPRLIKSHLH